MKIVAAPCAARYITGLSWWIFHNTTVQLVISDLIVCFESNFTWFRDVVECFFSLLPVGINIFHHLTQISACVNCNRCKNPFTPLPVAPSLRFSSVLHFGSEETSAAYLPAEATWAIKHNAMSNIWYDECITFKWTSEECPRVTWRWMWASPAVEVQQISSSPPPIGHPYSPVPLSSCPPAQTTPFSPRTLHVWIQCLCNPHKYWE